MSAHNSGMNILIEFAPDFLENIVANRFGLATIIPPSDAGYGAYRLTPTGEMTLAADTPSPGIDLVVRLAGVRDGENFRYDDLVITFGVEVAVGESSIEVHLVYQSVSSDVEGLHGALTGLRLSWTIPLDFLNLLDFAVSSEAAYVKTAGGVLAIGVHIDGYMADAAHFTEHFDTNFLTPRSQMSIAVEREMMEGLLDIVLAELVRLETEGDVRILDGNYRVRNANYSWETTHVALTTEGEYFYETILGNWWSSRVESDGIFFVDDAGSTGTRIRMRAIANIPDDAHLIGADAWADGTFHRRCSDESGCRRIIEFITRNAWSPAATFLLDGPGSEMFARESLGHTDSELTIPYTGTVEAFLGDPLIVVEYEDPLRITFHRHYTRGAKCTSGTWVDEGSVEAYFRIRNDGSGPLHVRLETEPEDIFHAYVLVTSIEPGGSAAAHVALLIDYRNIPDGTHHGSVRIIHNDPDHSDIIVGIVADVTYSHNPFDVLTDVERNVYCAWADIVMLARGFSWMQRLFPKPADRPDYVEVFEMAVEDTDDRYEFIARSEEGALLAMDSSHDQFKQIHLAGNRTATTAFEIHDRSNPGSPLSGPFFWTLRSKTIEFLADFDISDVRSVSAYARGACIATGIGLTVIETIDPWRPLPIATLTEAGGISGVVASGHIAYVVGNSGLAIVDLSNLKHPKLRPLSKDFAQATAMQRYGRLLWVASETALAVVNIANQTQAVPLARTSLAAPAIDVVTFRNRAVVLNKGGLSIFDFDGKELNLAGKYTVKQTKIQSLSTHGSLVCLTDVESGTQMLDISNPEKPQLVARYTSPFWSAGMDIDMMRGIAYKSRPKGSGIDIYLIKANRLPFRCDR